nr:retrovirus-related Pol polyprotein from transposon TNT 1-94 [Tanacetum cinerariifolium]
MIQVRLNATVCNIKTDNGTKFFNHKLRAYYEEVRISHQTFVARTPQQNGVVKRRNHTLVEDARTIKPDLSYLLVFGALCYPTNDGEYLVPVVIALEAVVSTGTPSSTIIDEDALFTKSSYEESTTQNVTPNNVHSINQPLEHINKWTKDHSIDNVISYPSRPVSTQHQLKVEALFYYFDAFLSSVEPKSYKEALTESCWIKSMQEELNEFERLEV